MIKLAFFVEGQTELFFLKQMLIFISREYDGWTLECQDHAPKLSRLIFKIDGHEVLQALLSNSGQDERVNSDIVDNFERLLSEGYNHICGLRDLHPHLKAEFSAIDEKQRRTLHKLLHPNEIRPKLFYAVMEIESWFLQEHHHYTKINPQLTIEALIELSGFDPRAQTAEDLVHPSKIMDDFYWKILTTRYSKSRAQVELISANIDFENLESLAVDYLPSYVVLNAYVRSLFFEAA